MSRVQRQVKNGDAEPVSPPAPQAGGLTTISVSPAFAEAVKEAARGAGVSVAAFCDREYLPDAREVASHSLRTRLEKMELARQGG